MSKTEHTIALDHFSEYAMALETDDYPKTDFTQFQFRGPIDYGALSRAFDTAMEQVPLFSCHLTERRQGLFYQPLWVFDREMKNRLTIEDCRHMAGDPFDPMDFSTRYHLHRTRRRIDLRREFPVRCFLVRVKDDEHIFSILFHHSVMDPAKAYRMFTTMLAVYHELVKGRKPEWADSLGMAALERKEGYVTPIPMRTFAKEQITDVLLKNAASKVANVATRSLRPIRSCKGRISLRAVVDDEDLMWSLLERAARNEATLNDLIFACARRVLTEWNKERGASYDKFRFMLITSLKGRTPLAKDTGAGLAGLNFVSPEGGRGDLDELIRFFRDARRDQLRRGIDVQFHHTMRWIVQAARLLPLSLRLNLVRPLLERIPCTFYLSNLGTVWPKIVDGKQSFESLVLGAGDFTICDIHSSASISRNLGLGLTVRSHNRRFYMNFVCDRFRFEEDEARELTGRIVDEFKNAG